MYGRATSAEGDRLLDESERPAAAVGQSGGKTTGYGADYEHNRRLQAHPDRIQAFRAAMTCPPVYTAAGMWLDMLRIPTTTVTPADGDGAFEIALAEHVEKNLGIGRVSPVGHRWDTLRDEFIMGVLLGYGLAETIPVEAEGAWYTRILWRDPGSCSRWVVDDNDRLVAWEQQPLSGWSATRAVVPMSQTLHLCWRPMGPTDFSGVGALRPAEPLARDHAKLCGLRMVAAQRWAVNTPMAEPDFEEKERFGVDDTTHKANGESLDNVLKNYAAHERAYLRRPPGWKLSTFGAAPDSLAAIDALIDSTARRIYEVWLQQWLMLGSAGSGGSYNLSEVHLEAARSSAQGVCNWLAGELNAKLIPRIVRWQFGPDVPLEAMPRIDFDGLASEAFVKWLSFLPSLVSADLLRVDDSIRDAVRKAGELPAEDPDNRPGPPRRSGLASPPMQPRPFTKPEAA